MNKRFSLFVVLIAVSASYMVPTIVWAQDEALSKMSLQQRLERIESLLDSGVLVEQVQSMDALREEITLLREQMEQQGYELENIKQRQRSLYLDMDRRISNVEAGSGSSRTRTRSNVPVPPPNTGTAVRSRSPGSVPTGAGKDGKPAYDKAFKLLKEGRYQASIKSFESFMKQYPDSKYADNAQYWLGEANYASRDYKKALNEFQGLIAKYPDSTKIPGAKLKVGYVYFELKNWSASRNALQQVIQAYPGTIDSKKAKERLERIKREGH